jgi:NADH-quinone oxidoreductase subunit F
LCGLGQSAPNPVLTALRHFRHEFEDHIVAQRCRAGVCEELVLSPCENSCPLHMNIPRFLELFKEGKLDEAYESVVIDNPLPASTGRVCQHPCDNRCRRQTLDEAVNMRDVHRLIADTVFASDRHDELMARVVARRMPPSGRKIAVAGAGPAGLTAAYYLAMLGHEVTVFESKAEAGGMLRYVLPEYRLPKEVLRKELQLIERMGVKFVFDTRVGFDLPLHELDDRFDAVFLSFGTWKESWVYLAGTELKGVWPALPFLEGVARAEPMELGKKVAIIGGGNAAIDSARTVLRMGAEALIVYRRERKDMPAIEEETLAAEDEGAKILFLAAPHRIIGTPEGRVKALEVVKTKLGEYDSSGRRKPVPTGEIQRYECDSVILAVGESVDMDLLQASGLKISERNTIDVDRYSMETSRPRFFAGGDVVSGASNLSNAMGYGKKAARNIDERLMGVRRWSKLFPEFEYDQEPPLQPSESRRHHPRHLPAHERVKGVEEVVVGLTQEEACEEASRCLRCDVKAVSGR